MDRFGAAVAGAIRFCLAFAVVLPGCSGLHNAAPPVVEELSFPTAHRLGVAALHGALHPATWAPAVGAAVLTIDDLDSRLVTWASSHNPVFGSRHTADQVSTILDGVVAAGTVASALAVPAASDSTSPWTDRAGRLGVEVGAMATTEALTIGLKDLTDRTRPNGEGHSSFPSGHTSFAFSLAAQTSRNLDAIDLADPVRTALDAGNYTLGTLVGWARVEADKHFPTDALAGAAIGNFIGIFVHDAFLPPRDDTVPQLTVTPMHGGLRLALTWAL